MKLSMKFPVFTRVIVLSGLATAAVLVAVAQQPSSPASPASPKVAPGTPAPPAPPAPSTPAAAADPASNLAPDAVVLTIGDQKITRAQFELLLASLAQNGRPAATPADKRKVAEQFGDLESMAHEARKRMLDQSAETKQMLAVQTDNVLANVLAKKITDEVQLTDPDLQAYYNAHKEEFEDAKGSHILIRFKGSSVPLKPNEKDLTEPEALAKAQDIRAKLMAGADFATLAKAESDDTGSAAKGGDLGTFRHKQMVGPFDEAAFTLPIGQVSEPVRTAFGYHIIKITSRTAKSFDDAKPEIEKQIKPKVIKEAMDKIKAQTPVTLNDQYFVK
jgi:peptidyl-prolyl cis-trans isomerase C